MKISNKSIIFSVAASQLILHQNCKLQTSGEVIMAESCEQLIKIEPEQHPENQRSDFMHYSRTMAANVTASTVSDFNNTGLIKLS